MAASTDHKDFELNDVESGALAQQSDDLMIEFFPTVQSKWIKLVIFLGSLLGIFGKKYIGYAEKISKENKNARPLPDSDSPVVLVNQGGEIPVNPMKRF